MKKGRREVGRSTDAARRPPTCSQVAPVPAMTSTARLFFPSGSPLALSIRLLRVAAIKNSPRLMSEEAAFLLSLALNWRCHLSAAHRSIILS